MENVKKWPQHLFNGNATAWIKDEALKFCKGDGIDFGANQWCLQGAIPVDHSTYFSLEDFDPGSLDYVFSSHCLEHITEWEKVLKILISKIKPNGIIFLYLPHEDSPWTGWRKHKWTPTLGLIFSAFVKLNVETLEYCSTPDNYQSFHVIGKKRVQ